MHRLGIGETPTIGVVPNGPVLDEHADHLLQEQRVAVRSIERNADTVGRAGLAEQRLRQRSHRRHVEPGQRRRGQPRDRLPRQAEQQHRRRPRVAPGVGQQLIDRGVGPLQIVEHDRDRPEPRRVLDHEPGRAHDVAVAAPGTARIVHTEQRPQVRRHRKMVRPRDPPGHAIDRRACGVDGRAGPHTQRARNDLRERGQPAFAERGASAQEEPTGCKGASELLREPALSDARLAREDHHTRTSVRLGSFQLAPEQREELLPIHERAPAGRRRVAREGTERLERGDRLGLPLGLAHATRAVADRRGRQRSRRRIDQHVASGRQIGHARSGVHRVAHHRVPGCLLGRADHHLAGVHTGVHLRERQASTALIQSLDVVAHGQRGTHRSFAIVLVRGGNAEHGHEPVALDLGYGAPERLDDALELEHRRAQERVDLLGVERLGERGIPREVGEEHRDELALARARGGRPAGRRRHCDRVSSGTVGSRPRDPRTRSRCARCLGTSGRRPRDPARARSCRRRHRRAGRNRGR